MPIGLDGVLEEDIPIGLAAEFIPGIPMELFDGGIPIGLAEVLGEGIPGIPMGFAVALGEGIPIGFA